MVTREQCHVALTQPSAVISDAEIMLSWTRVIRVCRASTKVFLMIKYIEQTAARYPCSCSVGQSLNNG